MSGDFRKRDGRWTASAEFTVISRRLHRRFMPVTEAEPMAEPLPDESLERQLEAWRSSLRARRAGPPADLAAAEHRLRAEIAALAGTGLDAEERFLVAARRVDRADHAARPLGAEPSDGTWKQFGAVRSDSGARSAQSRRETFVAFGLAVLAGVLVKVPALFGLETTRDEEFYARNASLFVLPCLVGYFAWKRRLGARTLWGLAGAFVVAAGFANVPGFGASAAFGPLTALHLPIALWAAVGIAYAGSRWREVAGRMDFIRFSGELFIYFVLIALGGGVLCAFMALTFKSIGVDIGPFFGTWLLPCGAAGAVLVASWLVEAKQSVIEAMAPVLTRLFTPLFAAMLVAFLGTLVWSGRGIDLGRELLIGFDLLLVVVLGLLVYSVSARDPEAPPGAFDILQVVLVVSALAADAVTLWAIGARIGEFGFSPNRVAALGENVILLVNLAGSAVLYVRFLLGRGSFRSLERWQTGYLPVYAGWAAIVVIVFPPLFRAL